MSFAKLNDAKRIPSPLEHTYQGTRHYLPLDGLRAIAITLVFWAHYTPPFNAFRFAWLGWTGVDLFFVLSGFLITGILYDTLDRPHFFRTFYTRRVLRIFPLYYAYWIVVAIAVLFAHASWEPALWAWIAYGGNFLVVHAVHQGLLPGFYAGVTLPVVLNGKHPQLIFGHFWSLCVEEQYYLMWPFFVYWLRDRRRLMTACAVGILLTIALRFALQHVLSPALLRSEFRYEFTFARTDSLLMGGWLALALRGPLGIRAVPAKIAYFAAAASLVLFATVAKLHHTVARKALYDAWLQTYGFSLVAIMATAVLVAALQVSWLKRVLVWPPLVQLGRISYGFYVLHFLALGLIKIDYHSRTQQSLAYLGFFALTWGISWLSFRYFEQPFLRLKDRWAPQRERPVPTAA